MNLKPSNSHTKRSKSLIDSAPSERLLGKLFIVSLLLLGSLVSAARSVESGQFTTTVKKELLATTTATTTAEPSTTLPLARDGSLEMAAAAKAAESMLGPAAAELFKPRGDQPGDQVEPLVGPGSSAASGLLPDEASLFSKDAVDVRALDQMDCHLRNMDYCYAGMVGASSRALPETDAELEVRCDELRSMASCMALYNRRCQTVKVFSILAPMAQMEQSIGSALPPELAQMPIPLDLPPSSASANYSSSSQPISVEQVKLADLITICSPQAKSHKANKLLRRRLFQVARCVNQRIPHLSPCIEDLKAAVQLFYEPRRALPMKPTCCALSRFRNCSVQALDNICGLSSFSQLEQTLTSGPGSMFRLVERVCRPSTFKFDSPYCVEVLPPSGMKAPQRRGHRASKLAKALDLISFAPAAQPM